MSYVLEYHYNTIEKKKQLPKKNRRKTNKWLWVFVSVLAFYCANMFIHLLISGQKISQLIEMKKMFALS